MTRDEKIERVVIHVLAGLALLVNFIFSISVIFSEIKQERILYKRIEVTEGRAWSTYEHYYFMLTDGVEYEVPQRLYDDIPQGAAADFRASILSDYLYGWQTESGFGGVVVDVFICLFLLLCFEYWHYRSKEGFIPYMSCLVFCYLLYVM